MKEIQSIPTRELFAFEKRLLDKVSAARDLCDKINEEQEQLEKEKFECEEVIKVFKKRKGYIFQDLLPEFAWLDVHARDEDTTEEEYNAIIRVKQLRYLLEDKRVEYARADAEARAYMDACNQAEYFTNYDINSKM